MTNITNIPLNKLTAWEGNVRKTQNKAGIDELAASIKAHGLQQNLVVTKDGKKFAVVAGGRRLKALQRLAKAGEIEATCEVPCRITEAADAAEISLAENVVREEMHPADQFEAFRDLADTGMPATDIAARFGKSDNHVLKILKLSRVSPKILKAYRAANLTLEDVMAFTVTDDHEAQERVLAAMAPWQGAQEIRAALTENDIAATDKRVKFVTLRAYEKAGGTTRRDLFSDDDRGVYIEDLGLLDTLVTERLEKNSRAVRAEGWKWVQVTPDFAYQQSAEYRRIHAEPVPLTTSEQKKLDKLTQEYDALVEKWREDEEPSVRLDELEKLIAEIEDREDVWTLDQFAMAGAVVSIDHQGKVKIERGFVRPEDMPKKIGKAKNANPSGASGNESESEQSAGLSASLIENLTAHKSAALAASLLDAPDKGLAAVVYALVLDVFRHRHDTALKLSATVQSLQRVEGSTAFQRIETARETWGQRIPGTPGDIWTWCLEQDQSVLVDLLTFCAACTINAVQMKADRPDAPRLVHAGQLAAVLHLDMTAWFTPTAENYFNRVSKLQILEALQEARQQPPAPAWGNLKKAELAALAARETAATGWLPLPLRQSP
ncbi:MAG TPA: ParB/RepB/Spo0J family partition protein [Candidatus Acidoferrales bacterium]|nr:ParB/RepB/Spo0J family partition protein [Candidatus Acidoferrales bacterium]